LYVDALTLAGKGGVQSTLDAADRAVSIAERIAGPDDLETARALDLRGSVRLARGDWTLAVTEHQRALRIRDARSPRGSPETADCLERLSLALIRVQRYDEAGRALDRALAVRESTADAAPIPLARALELQGWLHRDKGDYTTAIPSIERAIAILQRVSPSHPEMAKVAEVLGDVQYLMGNLSTAERHWTDAMAVAQARLGAVHPTTVELQQRLAALAEAFGDLAEARRLRERTLPAAEQNAAECSPSLSSILDDLANSLRFDGDYARAREMYRRALTRRERCFGPNHQLTATVVHNLALLADEMGDFPEAVRLHEQAIRMWSTGLGPQHPYVARGLDHLAQSVAARGQLARAKALYDRALAIRERAFGTDHPDVARTLTNLAETSLKGGKLEEASDYLNRATDTYNRIGAAVDNEPDHAARVLDLRGQVELRRGSPSAARTQFADSLATRERIFGASHPLAATSRASLAIADFALGSYDEGVGAALMAETAGRDHLRFTIRYLPERQAMAYAAKRPKGLDLALSAVAGGHVADASPVLDSLIQSRGVILDELAGRTHASHTDADTKALDAALVDARQRFANLMLRSMQGEDPVPRALLDEARQRKEDAERASAERSAAVRADLTRSRAGVADIRHALPAGSVLVSFVRYDRTVVAATPTRTTMRTVPSYLAFVMRPDAADIVAVPIGSAAAVDASIERWREQVSGQTIALTGDAGAAETAYRRAGAELRRLVWDRIARYVAGAAPVLIVPDGAFNLVTFAALPTGVRGYLVEQFPAIHYLTAERDAIARDETRPATGLLAIGGAAFDARPSRSSHAPVSLSARRSGCGSIGAMHFEDLPGSREEVADIARLWSRTTADPPTMLTGAAATEGAVKKAIAGHRVVHLATHGFFLGSDCSAPSGTRSVGGLAPATHPPPAKPSQPLLDNPLLRSGIALSGANQRANAASGDDGILTAEEVAALNLESTEWAVLSACDTGVGEITAGEGVLGLRRAFQIAGARTVIMSLWSVEDEAARQWMSALYRNRLEKSLDTADSVRNASLTVLRSRRARGASTHPFYWAGFVAAGDWR
jgi:CHAT domain-containing protein/tetratricopeptide (TPR) repeat protein